MNGKVAFLVIVCIVVSVCFGSPIKEESNPNGIVVQLNDGQRIDAITINLEDPKLEPVQRNQQIISETEDDANDENEDTADCIPTPYGCIDINDPALRP